MPERQVFNNMNTPEEPVNPLQEKYPKLHITELVETAVSRRKKKTGERIDNPSKKLDAWMDVLEKIHIDREPAVAERIKQVYHKKYVMSPDEVPESYFELQKRIAREQGHGDVDIPENVRQEMSQTISRDQERSLDAWIDYLSSGDAAYPMWFKYYTFVNITKLADFDKQSKEFKKRSKSTTAAFPDINREALAYMADSLTKQYNLAPGKEGIDSETKNLLDKDANFGKLYAHAIEKIHPASEAELKVTEGRWIKYEEGSEGRVLAETLQGHGTGWCTAGEGTAQAQLDAGDFYVYYTKNEEGKYRVPRVAIRLQEGKMAEVRGVSQNQNLEPALVDIAREKMATLPGAKEYEKKTSDMQTLTVIEKKIKADNDLNRNELIFLYEINGPIEGFGYERDPRINKLHSYREEGEEARKFLPADGKGFPLEVVPEEGQYNRIRRLNRAKVLEEDMQIIFECSKDQIARNPSEITENTIAYVGALTPGIFQKLPETVEYIYAGFPENRIHRENLEIGGKTKEQLKAEINKAGMKIYDYAESMMDSPEFTTLKTKENLKLIRLSVADLGFPQGATTDEIYSKAKELGLELCPAETGPNYRLKYTNQPNGEYVAVGMKQIALGDGGPGVFGVRRGGGGLWLDGHGAGPTDRWGSVRRFVFSLRPSSRA